MPSATAMIPVSGSTRYASSLRSRLRPGSLWPQAHNLMSLVLRTAFADVAILAAQDLALPLDLREQADRSRPQLRRVPECVAGLRAVEVDALVDVAQQQLALVLEVAVLDEDHRLPAVRQHPEQLILHLLELAAHDLPVAA